MKDKIKKLIFNASLTDEEFHSIENDIAQSNMQNIKIFSAVAFVFIFVMFILSFAVDGIASRRWLYFTAAVFDAAAGFLSGVFFNKWKMTATISMYIFISVLFAFGIVLGAMINTDQLAVTFIAILLTGPMLFVDRPVRMIPIIYISVVVFILTAINHKSGEALDGDIVDSIVFGTISVIISTYMMCVKCKEHLYEKKAVILSETDLLTGLKNRNSFERNIKEYPNGCKKNIVCVYADVNGLHEVNNTKGHEAGDRMLRFVADKIAEKFGTEHTYRIGGDEFVAFDFDRDDDISAVIDSITSESENAGYNVSVGYAVRECGDDMDGLIKAAEAEMFAAKKEFYERTGYHRRSGFKDSFVQTV